MDNLTEVEREILNAVKCDEWETLEGDDICQLLTTISELREEIQTCAGCQRQEAFVDQLSVECDQLREKCEGLEARHQRLIANTMPCLHDEEEITKLRARNEELEKQIASDAVRILYKRKAEKLEAHNERLTSALESLCANWDEFHAQAPPDCLNLPDIVHRAELHAKAREALAGEGAESECPPHDWGQDGERCSKCGTKDWMT